MGLCKNKGPLLAVLLVWMVSVQAVQNAVSVPRNSTRNQRQVSFSQMFPIRTTGSNGLGTTVIGQSAIPYTAGTTANDMALYGINTGTLTCPQGSIFQNGQCMQQVSYCGAGYNLVGNTCVGQSVCQAGYNLVNGQCHLQSQCPTQSCNMVQQPIVQQSIAPQAIVQQPILQQPIAPQAIMQQAIVQQPAPVQTVCRCESGSTLTGNQCVKTVTKAAETRTIENNRVEPAICPAGYDLNYEECLQHNDTDARCTAGALRNNVCVVPSSCRASYQLDAYGRCIKNSSVEATCPPDSRLIDGTVCLYNTPQCPAGYRSERGVCTMRDVVPVRCEAGSTLLSGTCQVAQPSCPSDYRLSGGQCVKERHSVPSCPSGTQQRDDMCVVLDLECQPGYQKINGACVRREVQPARCPPGSRLMGDVCQAEVEVCPRGFNFMFMECVRNVERSPTCPPGLQLIGGECVRTQPLSCDPGYTLTNNECVRQETGRYSCPAGSYLRDGYCVTSEANCDSGFELRDGVCVLQQREQPYCPPGSVLRGRNCVYRLDDCPPGYVRKGDQCVNEDYTHPTCPNGFKYRKGYCLAVPQCEYGYTYNQTEGICISSSSTPLSCPSGSIIENYQCVSRDLMCVEGYTAHEGQCRLRLLASPVCPTGTSLHNGRCRTRTTAMCRAGTIAANGMCEMQETAYPQCPAGYSFQNGQCVGMMQGPARLSCQIYGGCQNPCANNMCGVPCAAGCATQNLQTIQTTQPARCPDGFNNVGNGYCTRRTTVHMECPIGSTMEDGACVMYHSMMCAPGSVPEGDRCVRYQYRQGSCREGFTRSGDRCILINPPCPSGYRNHGGSCITLDEKTATCPPNSNLRSGLCVSAPLCPPGYSIHDDKCEREDVVPIKCPDGFVYNGNECMRRFNCPAGFRFEQNECVRTQRRPVTCPLPSRYVQEWCVVEGPLCEPGFEYKDNRCVRTDTRKPLCPRDTLPRNGVCESRHRPQCEPGFNFDSGKCTKVEKRPNQCPQDFIISGERCVSWKVVCPAGFDFNRNECVREHRHTLTCPAGSNMRNNVCFIGRPACDHDFKLIKGTCIHESYTSLECPPDTIITDGQCVKNAYCPPEYVLRDNQCEKLRTIALTCQRGNLVKGDCVAHGPNCPQGYEFRRGLCFRRETVEPSCPPDSRLQNNYCVIGRPECFGDYRYSNGRCTKVLRTRAICSGQTELKNGMCVWVEKSSSLYCDLGYTLQGSSCTQVVYTQAICTTQQQTTTGVMASPLVSSGSTISNTIQSIPTTISVGPVSSAAYVQPDSSVSSLVTSSVPSSNVFTDDDRFDAFLLEESRRARIDGSNVELRIDHRPEYVLPSAENRTLAVETVSTTESSIEQQTEPYLTRQQRCTVYGPRVCTTENEETWTCEQKQYNNIASRLCTSESTAIHLSVQSHISVNDKMLVMAPNEDEGEEYEDENYDEGTANCAECSDGSFSCSKYCYTYDECNNCEYTQLEEVCQDLNIRECAYLSL